MKLLYKVELRLKCDLSERIYLHISSAEERNNVKGKYEHSHNLWVCCYCCVEDAIKFRILRYYVLVFPLFLLLLFLSFGSVMAKLLDMAIYERMRQNVLLCSG